MEDCTGERAFEGGGVRREEEAAIYALEDGRSGPST